LFGPKKAANAGEDGPGSESAANSAVCGSLPDPNS